MCYLQFMSTEDLRLPERHSLYQAALWKAFSPQLELKVEKNSPLACRVEETQLADIGMYRLTATGHCVERANKQVRLDETHRLKVALQMHGAACYEQDGRKVSLSPGEWIIYDMTRPYRIVMPGDVEILLLVVPHERVDSKQFSLHDLTLKRYPTSEGLSKLTFQFIRDSFQEARSLAPRSETDIANTISNLIRLTMLDISGKTILALPKEILCERIKTYIAANLRDPQLSLSRIAAALKCTARYLHKAFEAEDVSISSYIWRMRLDQCCEDLVHTTFRNQSITDIALSWGFNSSTHFSTLFKEHFGISPRAYRCEMQAGLTIPATAHSDNSSARRDVLNTLPHANFSDTERR